jgi:hypothetical protein
MPAGSRALDSARIPSCREEDIALLVDTGGEGEVPLPGDYLRMLMRRRTKGERVAQFRSRRDGPVLAQVHNGSYQQTNAL